MTTIVTAALVKELRDRTHAGMMECKKALMEAQGDLDRAIEAMRKAGQAKAVKKASRIATEGTIVVVCKEDGKQASLIELNCETDFVAREEKFKSFAKEVGTKVLLEHIRTCEELQIKTDVARLALIAQLGENITIRRMAFYELQQGVIGTYAHGDTNGVRIGALVVLKNR
jgi:elongation factor Ts